jgi:hypothetical protein
MHNFHIEDKVNHMVSDNASNVTSAIKKLNCKQFRCFGHILNLIVSSTFKSIRKNFNSDKDELVDYNLEILEDVEAKDTSIEYANDHETTMKEIIEEYETLMITNSEFFKILDAGEFLY